MEIAKEIVSDIIKGVEELLWPQPEVEKYVETTPDNQTRVKESVEGTPGPEKEILSEKPEKPEKPGVLQGKVETGAVADICLQKYWFRISQGRPNLLVFCVFLTNVADIKVLENMN